MHSGMPKIGLKKFLVKTQKSAGPSKIYLVNLLSVCNDLTLKVTNTGCRFLYFDLKKIIDLFGQEIPIRKNSTMFYIYDDGSVEKKLIID